MVTLRIEVGSWGTSCYRYMASLINAREYDDELSVVGIITNVSP